MVIAIIAVVGAVAAYYVATSNPSSSTTFTLLASATAYDTSQQKTVTIKFTLTGQASGNINSLENLNITSGTVDVDGYQQFSVASGSGSTQKDQNFALTLQVLSNSGGGYGGQTATWTLSGQTVSVSGKEATVTFSSISLTLPTESNASLTSVSGGGVAAYYAATSNPSSSTTPSPSKTPNPSSTTVPTPTPSGTASPTTPSPTSPNPSSTPTVNPTLSPSNPSSSTTFTLSASGTGYDTLQQKTVTIKFTLTGQASGNINSLVNLNIKGGTIDVDGYQQFPVVSGSGSTQKDQNFALTILVNGNGGYGGQTANWTLSGQTVSVSGKVATVIFSSTSIALPTGGNPSLTSVSCGGTVTLQ